MGSRDLYPNLLKLSKSYAKSKNQPRRMTDTCCFGFNCLDSDLGSGQFMAGQQTELLEAHREAVTNLPCALACTQDSGSLVAHIT